MASTAPLTGSELIDCARANGPKGIDIAASRCGYEDVDSFEMALKEAGTYLGLEIHSFDDLITPADRQATGMNIAPNSLDEL